MSNLSKWNISVECDSTDVRDITVDAVSSKDALIKAEKWAKENNVENAVFSEPCEDLYDEFLEWTPEEEDEFLHMVSKSGNIDES